MNHYLFDKTVLFILYILIGINPMKARLTIKPNQIPLPPFYPVDGAVAQTSLLTQRQRWCTPLALLLSMLLLFVYSNPAYAENGLPGSGTIAVGDSYACAITSSGGLKCWGNNAFGKLGDGSTTNRLTPVDVVGLTSGVVAVASGDYSVSNTCALTSSGGVKCWGINFGTTPQDVTGLTSGVVAIAVAQQHECALTSSGGVKCWGYNAAGELGDGTSTNRPTTPGDVQGLTSGVIAIATGYKHTCALLSGGAVKCWGDNLRGQLGNGTTTASNVPVAVSGLSSGVIAIAVGYYNSCAALSSGGAQCWGNNDGAELGDGSYSPRSTPVTVLDLTDQLVDISSGLRHVCVLTNRGAVKCWGQYPGNGDTNNSSLTPVTVNGWGSGMVALDTDDGTCAMRGDGAVQCLGTNTYGQLGTGNTVGWYVPTAVSGLSGGMGAGLLPLRLTKSAPSPYPPVAGQPVAYTIVVTNTGTVNQNNLTLTDLPGPGLGAMTSFTSSPAGSCNTTTRQCTLSSALAPGGVATFNVTFNTSAIAGTVITNTAYVAADQSLMLTYPTTLPLAAKSVAATNLAVTKSASVSQVTPGTPFDYTITVTNNGTTTATNVKATDKLPAGVTFNSATILTGSGSCSNNAGIVTCTWGSVAAGASVSAKITVTP